MVQLCDAIISVARFSSVIYVSNVPLNVAGSAMVVTVDSDTSVHLSETLRLGGLLKLRPGACQLYFI